MWWLMHLLSTREGDYCGNLFSIVAFTDCSLVICVGEDQKISLRIHKKVGWNGKGWVGECWPLFTCKFLLFVH
jgi:hypothetical protein